MDFISGSSLIDRATKRSNERLQKLKHSCATQKWPVLTEMILQCLWNYSGTGDAVL